MLTLPVDDKFVIHLNYFFPANNNNLFNEPAYFKLHSSSAKDCYFQLVRSKDNQVFGTLAFHEISTDVYVSPGRGTFGGISLNGELEFLLVEKFLQVAVNQLRLQGAQMIRIRCAPAGHNGAIFAIVFNALMNRGFRPKEPEINYEMRIDGRSFIDRIEYGNVKRIRKSQREGFVCEHVDTAKLPEVYALISNNRTRLRVLVSMSLKELRQMAELFPNLLHLFAVYRDASCQEMVAAAICLTITPRVLYVLYWGDAESMRSFSPVAMLASCIYDFGSKQGFKQLDAGISTLHGEPNHGLINFKRNLGFTESLKLEMVWLKGSGMEAAA